jgi:uncharacterized membrane protein
MDFFVWPGITTSGAGETALASAVRYAGMQVSGFSTQQGEKRHDLYLKIST